MVARKKKPKLSQPAEIEGGNRETSDTFVGRDELLQELKRLLESNFGKQRLVYLEAQGGIGKTTLLKYGFRDFSDIQDLYRKLETARLSEVQDFHTLLIGDSTTDAPPPKGKSKKRGK